MYQQSPSLTPNPEVTRRTHSLTGPPTGKPVSQSQRNQQKMVRSTPIAFKCKTQENYLPDQGKNKWKKTSGRTDVQLLGLEDSHTNVAEDHRAKEHRSCTDFLLRGPSWPISGWEREGNWFVAQKKSKGNRATYHVSMAFFSFNSKGETKGNNNMGFSRKSLIFCWHTCYFHKQLTFPKHPSITSLKLTMTHWGK
jgi:hypothetical protein